MTGREPSVTELISGIATDAQHLVHTEIALAKEEIREEIRTGVRSAVGLALWAGIAATGGLLLAFSLASLLTFLFGLPAWVSYMTVGGALAGLGLIQIRGTKSRMTKVDLVPRDAIDSVRRDMAWIRQQTN